MRWVSRAELLGKGGLPKSNKRALSALLDKMGVRAQLERTNGGQAIFYALDDLPASIRDELGEEQNERHSTPKSLHKSLEARAEASCDDIEHARAAYDAATGKAKARADELARLLSLMDIEMGHPGASVTAAAEAVAARANIAMSSRTIRRAWTAAGAAPHHARAWLLLPSWNAPRSEWTAEEEAFWAAVWAEKAGVETDGDPFSRAWRRAAWKAQRAGSLIVSEARCRRRWNEAPATGRTAHVMGTSALRSHRTPTRRERPPFAMSVVSCDAYTANIVVRFPDGSEDRPTVFLAEDVHSSKILAWVPARTADAASSRKLVLDVIAEHGLPDCFQFDNGKEFAALAVGSVKDKHSADAEAREKMRRPLDRLNVAVDFTAPYNGREKTVERRIGDLQLDEPGAFPGAYVGNRPDNHPQRSDGQKKSRTAVAWADFEAQLAESIRDHNAYDGFDGKARPRRGEGKLGSFDATFAAGLAARSAAGRPVKRLTPGQWELARCKVKFLTPNAKTGSLTWDTGIYFDPVDFAQTNALLAARDRSPDGAVAVFFDPENPAAGAKVFDEDRRPVVERLPLAERTVFISEERRHEKKRTRSKVRSLTKKLAAAQDADHAAAVAALIEAPPVPPPPPVPAAALAEKVVAPAFGAPRWPTDAADAPPKPAAEAAPDPFDMLAEAYGLRADDDPPERKRASAAPR
jgi:hypothetical protein